MASDILFPFYEILVENIFGSIGLAIMAIAVLLVVILVICRTSMNFIMYWMIWYFIVMSVLYLGGLGLALGFIVSVAIVITQILRLTSGGGWSIS